MFGRKKESKSDNFYFCNKKDCPENGEAFPLFSSPLFTCKTCHKGGNYYSLIEHCVEHGHDCTLSVKHHSVRIR